MPQLLAHHNQIRLLRLLNGAAAPLARVWKAKEVAAQAVTGFAATFFALLQIPRLEVWFPVYQVRLAVLVSVGIVLGGVSAVPIIREHRALRRLRTHLRSHYAGYIIQALDYKLDLLLEQLTRRYDLGQLTASIMTPTGQGLVRQARYLRIVSASQKLRPLPSMALTLDWDEGVAGRIWKEGAKAAALVIRNDPEWFANEGINPIRKAKRRDGSFGHRVGMCVPINYEDASRLSVSFLGVLSIGSDRVEDVSPLERRDLQMDVYQAIKDEIAPELYAFCLADGTQELPPL